MIASVRSRLLLLLFALVACGDCTPAAETDPTEPSEGPEAQPAEVSLPDPDVRLIFLTDLKGYLAPCGCTSRPLGGIDHLAARVHSLSEGIPSVFMASGDLFFGDEAHGGPASHETDRWRAETLVDILNGAGLRLSTPGPLDFGQGQEAFVALRERAEFEVLGAGVELRGDAGAENAAEATTLNGAQIIEVDGHRIGVVGVSDLNPEATSAAEAALEALEETELRIALSRGPRRFARDVARLPGVSFVIQGGLDLEEAIAPQELGDAVLLHGGRQGQGVLVLDLYLRGEGPWQNISAWSIDSERLTLTTQIQSLTGRLEQWEAEGREQGALAGQRRRLERLQAELDALRPPSLPVSGNAFAARWEELAPESAEDEEVKARLAAFDVRVNTHNETAFAERTPPPLEDGEAGYVGSQACAGCHSSAYSWWQSHPHGRAYATLEELNKEFHLDCVGCHVTGYERPGGSTVTHLGQGGALQDVGCENCHGPASQHIAAPTEFHPQRNPPERVCVACHNEEHSDRFQYDAYRSTLLVPGHGRPANP